MSNFDTAFFERMRDWLDREAEWLGMHEDNTIEHLREAFEFAKSPPRPEEPTGLGAVVEDVDGGLWIRVGITIGDLHWRSTEPGNTNCFKWRAINAVRVLSEGVQP